MKKILLFLGVLIFGVLMAQEAEAPDMAVFVGNLIVAFTPLIVWYAGKVSKLAKKIPGIWMLTVIALMSIVLTFFTNIFTDPGVVWYIQLGSGLLANFIENIIKQLKSGN